MSALVFVRDHKNPSKYTRVEFDAVLEAEEFVRSMSTNDYVLCVQGSLDELILELETE